MSLERSKAGPTTEAQSDEPLRGGSYLTPRPQYYANTFMKHFRATDPGLEDMDVLELVLPHARARGMKVYPDLMEPMFNYLGHGSSKHAGRAEPATRSTGRRARTRDVGALPQQPRLPQLAARTRRGSLPQLRHRRDHVVQRASKPRRRGARRPAAALFLPPLLGTRSRRGHRRRPARARPRARSGT